MEAHGPEPVGFHFSCAKPQESERTSAFTSSPDLSFTGFLVALRSLIQ